MTAILNAALIRRRRKTLALTERDLATRLGVSPTVIHGIETDANHKTLPASLILGLARSLGVATGDLFLTSTPTDGAQATGPDDAAVLGALLLTTGHRVLPSALADITGWQLSRIETAVDALAHRAATVGLAVTWSQDGSIRLAPHATAASPEQVKTAMRRVFARTGMNLRQARMLHRAYRGEVTGAEQANPDRVALAELTNADLVTDPVTRGERPGLTQDVLFSLADFAPPTVPQHGL